MKLFLLKHILQSKILFKWAVMIQSIYRVSVNGAKVPSLKRPFLALAGIYPCHLFKLLQPGPPGSVILLRGDCYACILQKHVATV